MAKSNAAKALLSLAMALALGLGACRSKEEAVKDEPLAKEAGKEAESGTQVVTLSDASLENVELKTLTAAVGALKMKLKVPGRLSPDANRTAKVSATLEGRVTKLNQDIGDRVAQGAVMGLLETPELLDKPLVLHAPLSGIVTEKAASIGELVEKGKALYEISDPSRLWLIGEVREKDFASVHPDQKVDFNVQSYPGRIFHGKIARLGNAVESGSRTFEIRVEVENREGKLKPGMFADIEITTGMVQNALLIDDAALQTEGEDQIAFVALDGNRFEKRTVKVGLEEEGQVQVLEGIRAGERVVTEGSFTLKSELLKGELGEE
jgi:multidrug efflux pump subunit AcrA (membrane-fusion protein)